MNTLHVENTVHDYTQWKAVFDKFARFRADHGVRAYTVRRRADDPRQVLVDLEFDNRDEALAFQAALERIRRTPQSKAQLVTSTGPVLYDVVDDRQVSAAAASGS